MATTNSWSNATIAKLRALFDKGLSTSEIGRRLGFTKNAVVGKINRLKLNAKKMQAPTRKTAPAKPSKATAKPNPTKKDPTKRTSGSKTVRIVQQSSALMALRGDQCRWPLGDPDSNQFRFCGDKCFAGKPYCFEHCKVAYQFAAPAKKK